jgi:RNA polymerase sigma-70 factor (ECF subfamily)
MRHAITDDGHELELIRQASAGDARALNELFTRHDDRLKRMVKLRLDSRVQRRVDPADVVQEAYLEASANLADYLQEPKLPFFLWLRLLTMQKLVLAHRQHLGVQARDARREIALYRGAYPQASSAALAAQLMGRFTTPSQAAVRAEMKLRIQEALNNMDELDREVLSLRHFEQLSNSETALVLGLTETAACNRYVRALERLRSVLTSLPGGLAGM